MSRAGDALAGWLARSGLPGGARRGSPRIAIVGNCQARAVANAIRLLAPEAEVAFTSVFGIARRFPRLADLVAALHGADHVVAGRFAAPFRDGGTFEALRTELRAVDLPMIVFPAFHPDLVYVHDHADRTGLRLVQSGVGDYHSALVLFGYLEGLAPAEAARLFDPAVVRALGYLDLWDGSAAALLAAGREAGLDLSGELMRWTRRGVFMHSTNHPRMFVAADLARLTLARLGIPALDCDLDALLPDEFIRQGTWPVYPAIGEQYGVPGSEVFLTQGTRTGQAPRTMSRDAFIAASYASYGRHERADFACPRVLAWRTDPATWRMLRERASRL